jgi:hypothetical protein
MIFVHKSEVCPDHLTEPLKVKVSDQSKDSCASIFGVRQFKIKARFLFEPGELFTK